ncbi:MAG: STAS domain-containing protein [Methanomicrobiales archaeon]|nr:STAS domain-containing protein [Methanomicrobiales archaeon]
MVLETTTTDGILVIRIPPRLDADAAQAAGAELGVIVEKKPKNVVFDFSRTTYIASAGLRIILSSTRTIMKERGTVVLSSLSSPVRQVFEIAGFTKIFTITGSLDEALSHLRE